MKAVGDKVLIKQDDPQETVGREGILIAPQGKETWPNTGIVLAVGTQVRDVRPGDRVAFLRKPESGLDPEGRKTNEFFGIISLPEEYILAVFE